MSSFARCICFVFFAGFFLLQGCYSPGIELSSEEKEFVDSVSTTFKGKVSLFHSYELISQNERNGVLFLDIKNTRWPDLCLKDSTYLKDLSIELTKKTFRVLKHKANYSYLDVKFSTTERTDEKTESVICVKVIRTNMLPPYEAVMSVSEVRRKN